MQTLLRDVALPVSAEQAFVWHERQGAFERLNPPWVPLEVLERSGTIHDGDTILLRIGRWPLRFKWRLKHRDYIAGEQFCDEQVSGPFKSWRHTHRFEARDEAFCRHDDQIEYELPMGFLGRLLLGRTVDRRLQRLLTYRHSVLEADITMHTKYGHRDRLSIAVSGASGLVGSSLCALLTTGGHRVIRLARRSDGDDPDRAGWDTSRGLLEPDKLEGVDAVVHLAGENIAGRWTKAKMQAIRDSRVPATEKLVGDLCALKQPPRTLICASAIGYYGDRDDQLLDEDAEPGEGFLPQVCTGWEAATEKAVACGMRVVNARIGIVLTPAGGALAKVLPAFRICLGGILGSGEQWMSWISLDDLIAGFYEALMNEKLSGPVNFVAPHSITNRQFTETLGDVLRRPAIVPMPAIMLKAAMGRMANELLLASANVQPLKLLAAGYHYRHGQLEDALRHVLGRTSTIRFDPTS